MNWVPMIVLLGFSGLGLVLKKMNSPRFYWWQSRFYVINAFAVGITTVWVTVSWIRALFLIPFGHSWNVLDFVFAPAILFPTEGLILLVAVAIESFFLRGTYTISNEWKRSMFDGMKTAGLYVSLSTILFFPFWWMIQPGEFGKFKTSIVQGLVTSRADLVYESNPRIPLSTPEAITELQKAKAIPSALVIAALLASLAPLVRPTIQYFEDVLSDKYLHLPPKEKDDKKSPGRLPSPRGGGPN